MRRTYIIRGLQLATTVLGVWLAWLLLDWAVLNAVFRPDPQACRAAMSQGACWGVVAAKGETWLFGRYPEALHWRPALALACWGLALLVLTWPLWRRTPPYREAPTHAPWRARAALSLLAAVAGLALLWGLPFAKTGQPWQPIEATLWGGLPLTLLITGVTLVASLPLGVLLAEGRLSRFVALRWVCGTIVEVVRGAPLVMWLFMGAFLLPAIWPLSADLGPVARVLMVTTLFSAAYLAETLRGYIKFVGRDQAEAAAILGASWWTTRLHVVWPQALRMAWPPLTGHTIGLLKDTALVMIVSLQDLTGAMSMSLNGDADWRPYFFEAYLVIALAYLLMCQAVAWIGRKLEQRYPPPALAV